MARTLCPDRERASIALAAVLIVIFVGGSVGQVGAIIAGGLAGLWLCRAAPAPVIGPLTFPLSRRAGSMMLALFFVLLIALPLLRSTFPAQGLALFDAFYRAGALVFGGGHVVLPLLEAEVVQPGWVSRDAFLAGYGAAQAVPGPLFTFAAYLGAVMGPEPDGVAGAVICLVAGSCRASCSSSARCLSGKPYGHALSHRRRCEARMLPSLGYLARRSTSRCGRAPSCAPTTLRWRCLGLSFSQSGKRRRGLSCWCLPSAARLWRYCNPL